ncbi:MAG: ABC transporter permease [Bacteroidetes bacterium]|nr:ABC transporter permease [Bacteroidota bacterium]
MELKEGKYFSVEKINTAALIKTKGVIAVSKTIEENAYFKYGDKESIGTIKGVDQAFLQVTQLDSFVVYGNAQLSDGEHDYGIVGAGIDAALNVETDEGYKQIGVYLPKKNMSLTNMPQDAFNAAYLIPSGIFSIQQEFDEKYIIAPLSFVQYLAERDEDQITSLEIKTTPESSPSIQSMLEAKYGKQFHIRNRIQQNETLYRIMKIERWAVFAILSFVLLIISFNILGSLSMLVIEKKKDISILKAMGAQNHQIKKIFIAEGLIQSMIGAFAGVSIGCIICIIQQYFGIVKLGGSGTFVIDAYPVDIQFLDILLVFIIITTIAFIASIYPAIKASKQSIQFN